jgi:hypothetical protein
LRLIISKMKNETASREYTWDQVRNVYPNSWVLVQAMSSHSEGNQRVLDAMNVLDVFSDSEVALRHYLKLHREDRNKEMYVLHTDREILDINELKWAGIRAG